MHGDQRVSGAVSRAGSAGWGAPLPTGNGALTESVCTSDFGQYLPYTDAQRRETMQQQRTCGGPRVVSGTQHKWLFVMGGLAEPGKTI